MSGRGPRLRYYIYGVVLVVASLVSALLIAEAAPDHPYRLKSWLHPTDLWHAAPFLGSLLITIGWIVTSETAIRNSRKQHTIPMITSHLFDRNRASNRDIIRKYLPTGSARLTTTTIGVEFSNETHELLTALDTELNFFEFAAAAVYRDDIDERLFKECLRSQFVQLHDQAKLYIDYWRERSPVIWMHIAVMRKRWDRPSRRVRRIAFRMRPMSGGVR